MTKVRQSIGSSKLWVLALITVLVASSVGIAGATSGLVSYWLADGDPDDAADSNDGTLVNGATFASGKFGQAFSLDGVDDYVSVPDSPNLRLGASQTVAAWYKWAGGGTDDWRRLVGKGNSNDRNYGLWIDPQVNQVLFQISAAPVHSCMR